MQNSVTSNTSVQRRVEALLDKQDIRVNGDRPWDIRVHDTRFYARALTQGSLGLGESYMDGWWDSHQLDVTIFKLLRPDIRKHLRPSVALIYDMIRARILNVQAGQRAYIIGKVHYDVGNDLYQKMLDPLMTYTCGYWQDAQTLEEAQIAKLDLACRKIHLQPGQKVLDVGYGWGSFARYAAEQYGAHVVGITVSKEQVALGKELCAGLPIEIRLQDYRDVNEPFDHIVSFGMFEHVGHKNHRAYFEMAHRCLKDDGFCFLHTIGSDETTKTTDPWIERYIFPNSVIPSIVQIGKAVEHLFNMEDWHNFGMDYDRTLMEWYKNFETHWHELKERYDERFRRMWNYYLQACAAAFRARQNQLWQIVFSKKRHGGYRSIR
ncbi:cyclopropane fatty acyl phospholipid synthase [Candidatus Uhrbacteria bacterium]|nr:cyclopropane fatty acyl phospholipid synthase [Candidatus Uhrbacteria bacterium]MBD3284690.1 cyclopropane fatty acyl phospholipid synthase [Candidatus Uhrbacteria bacterium]